MTVVNSFDDINRHLEKSEAVLLYFSGENCAVCKALKPKIEQSFVRAFPQIKLLEIQTDIAIEATAKFGVFSLPTMILYIEQKEFLKRGRNVSVPAFEQEVKRIYELYFGGK